MQLSLIFPDSPNPATAIIETLDPEQLDAVLDVLIRLIAQTAQADLLVEENHDD